MKDLEFLTLSNYVGLWIYQGIRMIKRSERSFLWSLQTPLVLHTPKTHRSRHGPACYLARLRETLTREIPTVIVVTNVHPPFSHCPEQAKQYFGQPPDWLNGFLAVTWLVKG